MTVEELIKKLGQFPPNAKVILAEELGASELNGSAFEFRDMNYVEHPPRWEHLPPSHDWEFPSEYERKILFTEQVVVINCLAN